MKLKRLLGAGPLPRPLVHKLLPMMVVGSLALTVANRLSAEVLTTVDQVRNLTAEQAAAAVPVKLRGVVTFQDQALFSRFLQDETAGIYLLEMTNNLVEVTNQPALQAGSLVEVEGVTSPGEFAPVIQPLQVTVIGEGRFPAAKPVTAMDLVSGSEDSQFVELSGIVRSVQFEEETQNYLIDLVSLGERFTAYAKALPVATPGSLVDSTVRVRGVCSTLFNRLRQLFGFRLLVPRAEDLVIETAASDYPFNTPTQPIGSLLQFTPGGNHGHRVKVTGTVAYQDPGRAVFIQDESEGLYAQTRLRSVLRPGDVVEVLGFPAKGEYTPRLEDAIYRKVNDGQPPDPAAIDVDEVLMGTHDCRLITLKANVLERTQRGPEQFLVLESGGFNFHAYFGQDADVARLAEILNGSEVSVTGICLIERGSGWQAGEGWRAKSFRLLLPGIDAVKVIKGPPWWTQAEKLRVAGIISILVLAVLVLIDVLRRRPKAANGAK